MMYIKKEKKNLGNFLIIFLTRIVTAIYILREKKIKTLNFFGHSRAISPDCTKIDLYRYLKRLPKLTAYVRCTTKRILCGVKNNFIAAFVK